ncbi:DUF1493 family protein [Pacificimonas sp. WHA3]|uniref:DUF1493 family protein n=1 Tax=Pacificimonas pallii TaxID=2827236 RepID=A0ABS6SAZ3_9SPHN|nr:DUF1493 family protein [Pacificimonas pallii]MBV7255375.1 DUF1493 family protein [Pacificimonas pallii]
MTTNLDWLYDKLEADFGVPRRQLQSRAALVHDLGVTGDDAGELLEAIHDRFGTDFSNLNWTDFFHNEAFGLTQGCLLMLGMGPGMFAAIWYLPSGWPEWLRMLLAIIAGTTSLVVIGKLSWLIPWKFGEKRKVTLAGLCEIIDAGAWPQDPDQVT